MSLVLMGVGSGRYIRPSDAPAAWGAFLVAIAVMVTFAFVTSRRRTQARPRPRGPAPLSRPRPRSLGPADLSTMKGVSSPQAFARAMGAAESQIGPVRELSGIGDQAFIAGSSFLAVLKGAAAFSITLHDRRPGGVQGEVDETITALARRAAARL